MTTHITKTWFDGEKVVAQGIPESEIYEQEYVAWKQELGNILCLIHRDGGQYISEHGWHKAIGDATLKVAKLNAASDDHKPVAYKWKGELFTPGEIEMLDVTDAVPLYAAPIESKQEPVAFRWKGDLFTNPVPLYEHPRQWVGLTDEEIMETVGQMTTYRGEYEVAVGRAIEAKLKAKNEAT